MNLRRFVSYIKGTNIDEGLTASGQIPLYIMNRDYLWVKVRDDRIGRWRKHVNAKIDAHAVITVSPTVKL